MFWAFAAMIVFMLVLYQAYPQLAPRHQDTINLVAAIALGVLALLWRGVLVRRTLTAPTLRRIDEFIAVGSGATLAVPRPAFAAGCILLLGVAVLLAAAGSRILYGLRRQVTEAMQLGQYKLVRKIGEGGMGVVYLAHHMLLRRPTAVKLLPPDRVGADNLERF